MHRDSVSKRVKRKQRCLRSNLSLSSSTNLEFLDINCFTLRVEQSSLLTFRSFISNKQQVYFIFRQQNLSNQHMNAMIKEIRHLCLPASCDHFRREGTNISSEIIFSLVVVLASCLLLVRLLTNVCSKAINTQVTLSC
jgi:hypothetical protein